MEFNDNEAIYLQIVGLICERIMTGKWKAGDKILSVRDMAVEMAVNPNTVMRSYELLQELEIVFNRRGHGLYVAMDGEQRVVDYLKRNFSEQYLPGFFKQCQMLGIDMADISKQYDSFISAQAKRKKLGR